MKSIREIIFRKNKEVPKKEKIKKIREMLPSKQIEILDNNLTSHL